LLSRGFNPVGGSGKLTDVLAETIRERGTEGRLHARVERIVVERGRVAGIVLGDGTRIDCRALVSNADVKRTFLELVEHQHLPSDFLARVKAARPANSAFMVHPGVDFVPDTRPALHVSGELDVGI